MPSLFLVGGYRVFFWSNEGLGPVHVHVCQGKPSPNAAKVWLTRSGGAILAGGSGRLPAGDADELLRVIAAQHAFICDERCRFFAVDELRFYC